VAHRRGGVTGSVLRALLQAKFFGQLPADAVICRVLRRLREAMGLGCRGGAGDKDEKTAGDDRCVSYACACAHADMISEMDRDHSPGTGSATVRDRSSGDSIVCRDWRITRCSG